MSTNMFLMRNKNNINTYTFWLKSTFWLKEKHFSGTIIVMGLSLNLVKLQTQLSLNLPIDVLQKNQAVQLFLSDLITF